MTNQTSKILIPEGNEIISMAMAQHIVHMFHRGCTPECMACHFRNVWNREMAVETFEAFLDHDFQPTDQLVPHGESEIGGHQIPTGLVYEIVYMFYNMMDFHHNLRAEFISKSIDMFYKVKIDTESIFSILDHWQENLPRNENGVGVFNPRIRPRHDGRHLHSLPSTPLTPEFGRSDEGMASTIPPPLYSPRRSYRGRELRHPRQVNEQGSHLPPFYDANNTPSPPSYDAANPAGSPRLPRYASLSPILDRHLPFAPVPNLQSNITLHTVPALSTDFAVTGAELRQSPFPAVDDATTHGETAAVASLAHAVMVMELFGSPQGSRNSSNTSDVDSWMTISIGMPWLNDTLSFIGTPDDLIDAGADVLARDTADTSSESSTDESIFDLSLDIDDDAMEIIPRYESDTDTSSSNSIPQHPTPTEMRFIGSESSSTPVSPLTIPRSTRVRFADSPAAEDAVGGQTFNRYRLVQRTRSLREDRFFDALTTPIDQGPEEPASPSPAPRSRRFHSSPADMTSFGTRTRNGSPFPHDRILSTDIEDEEMGGISDIYSGLIELGNDLAATRQEITEVQAATTELESRFAEVNDDITDFHDRVQRYIEEPINQNYPSANTNRSRSIEPFDSTQPRHHSAITDQSHVNIDPQNISNLSTEPIDPSDIDAETFFPTESYLRASVVYLRLNDIHFGLLALSQTPHDLRSAATLFHPVYNELVRELFLRGGFDDIPDLEMFELMADTGERLLDFGRRPE